MPAMKTLESRKAKRGRPLRAATGSAWERDLWAVEMRSGSCRPEPILIGDAWHSITAPKYPGEPSRCLLFRTRKLARAWCVEATVKHAKHSTDWRFRPVRVRETVKPNAEVSASGDDKPTP
jgi:hypothetical protein